MKNFRVSIQEQVKAFNKNELIGETSLEVVEDYCKKNNILIPLVWNEKDSQTIGIIEKYFQDN